MRIVFFGSSDFSLPALETCFSYPDFTLTGVITTPPQKQGRGLELKPTCVADFCRERNILCRDYQKLSGDVLAEVQSWKTDIFVVASYGKMIPEAFLKLAQYRFNIHPSLLPKYRGASPLNGPILAGDTISGLSIADITKDLDAGDIYFQKEMSLSPKMDSEKLGQILSIMSQDALRILFDQVKLKKLTTRVQNHALSCYAPKLKKEDGRLHFSDSAQKWDRVTRGLKPWPSAFIQLSNERINLMSLRVQELTSTGNLGAILAITSKGLIVQTAQGSVEWLQVKPAGKKEMLAADYARGKRLKPGDILI